MADSFLCIHGGINLIGAIVNLIFAEAEVQEWAKSKPPPQLDAKLSTKEDKVVNGKLYLHGEKEQEIENGVINHGYGYDVSVPGASINSLTKF